MSSRSSPDLLFFAEIRHRLPAVEEIWVTNLINLRQWQLKQNLCVSKMHSPTSGSNYDQLSKHKLRIPPIQLKIPLTERSRMTLAFSLWPIPFCQDNYSFHFDADDNLRYLFCPVFFFVWLCFVRCFSLFLDSSLKWEGGVKALATSRHDCLKTKKL